MPSSHCPPQRNLCESSRMLSHDPEHPQKCSRFHCGCLQVDNQELVIQVLIKPVTRLENTNVHSQHPSTQQRIRYDQQLTSKVSEYSLNKHILEIRERALHSRNSTTGQTQSGLIDFHPDILFDSVEADKNSRKEKNVTSTISSIFSTSPSKDMTKEILNNTFAFLYRCDPDKITTEKLEGTFNPEVLDKSKQCKLQRLLPRHPNLVPIRGVVEGSTAFYVISNWRPYSLSSVLRFSADAIQRQETKLFLIFQLLHCVQFLHSRGICHGSISPSKLLVSNNLWLSLAGINPFSSFERGLQASKKPSEKQHSESIMGPIPQPIIANTPSSETYRWIQGEISNFDYLMHLNRLAGRISGGAYPSYHPVFPWVVDFTEAPPRGFRDLSKTKFRLKKGDEQLDFTYIFLFTNMSLLNSFDSTACPVDIKTVAIPTT